MGVYASYDDDGNDGVSMALDVSTISMELAHSTPPREDNGSMMMMMTMMMGRGAKKRGRLELDIQVPAGALRRRGGICAGMTMTGGDSAGTGWRVEDVVKVVNEKRRRTGVEYGSDDEDERD